MQKEKKIYCDFCNTYTIAKIVSKKETFKVRGENITIQSSVLVCKECERDIFDEELDGKNIELVYNEYRKKHKLLFPSEIKEIREKYGLSQRALSRLLEWGEVTINRYETGALQDKAHDFLLRLISDPQDMYKVYESQKDFLSRNERMELKERLDSLLGWDFRLLESTSYPSYEKSKERLVMAL